MNIPLVQSTFSQSPTVSVYIQAILHCLSVVFGNGVLSECIFSENNIPAGSSGGFLGFFPRFPSTGGKILEFDFLNWLFCFPGFDFL